MKRIKNKKGQIAVEYIMAAAFLFAAFALFYKYYSWITPKQFEQGAKIILTVNEE
ncbi:MAG: hypothetical protein HN833_03225 [Elusimicrobiaceae bacterium]|jgi:hypothetical protein|nr:hypothetical protein [Elusimicrobiaceae bacterium]MBT3954628.1 hypothetical protein [Elusimicrobiaceae bacterium]MBT4007936.1 hypothetical protein [Elusimicrobiaceae bacterium]MBT4403138.1 hypothetical protein [Elusimicrobiaceae bacterium]MBT4439950.1 hypothetical protein [Elusimicrobiaceae bacterium]